VDTVVEVGGWEHECCGPSYERDAVVTCTCAVVPDDDSPARYVESHHDVATDQETVVVQGRVVDIHVRHADGSVEQIHRLPSGRALRGFDEHDDGHLEKPWTGEPVRGDSGEFLVTVARDVRRPR
jgi:hypothetical protein